MTTPPASSDIDSLKPPPGLDVPTDANTGLDTLQAEVSPSAVQLRIVPQLTEEQTKSIVVGPTPIAHGGYADVYKGFWTNPDTGKPETVAVKVLRFSGNMKGTEDEARALDVISKRLGREVFVWQRLHHPRVLPLLGYTRTARMITDTERPCIISPWRNAGNLDRYVRTRKGVDKLALLIQAAEAINVLHTFDPIPVIHLDIKPDNFLVNDSGEVELCDFGISRVLDGLPSGFTTGLTSGTYPYQAPEYLLDGTRSAAADVYSFGCVILQVLSGKAPFAKVPQGRLIRDVTKGKRPNKKDHQFSYPSSVEDKIWGLMNDCWSHEAKDRPTMAAVIQELTRIRAVALESLTPS